MTGNWDVIVVGAGSAGMMTSIFAARRGARVLTLEVAPAPGGTLHVATGQMSAAGTQLQKDLGISDTPEEHYADVMRISHHTADPTIVRLAVENAAATFDWLLEHGFRALPNHPVFGANHEPYQTRRYYWGPKGGISVLEVVRPQFLREVEQGRVTLQVNTEATSLIQDKSGRVIGVRARTNGAGEVDHFGTNVALTTGGYAANARLFEELSGYPLLSDAAYPYSQGAGIRMAQAVGGWLRGREHFLCSFGAILESENFPARIFARPIHHPEVRQPWELYVNARGDRFMAEDEPSVDLRERALMVQPGMCMWMVFDSVIAAEAPSFVGGLTKSDLMAKFGNHPMFFVHDTVAGLAAAAGINPEGLQATIAAYNAHMSGSDPWRRKHRPRPLATGPFYAVRLYGASVSSTVGLGVDSQLRLLDGKNQPIPGVYVAGELIGGGQTMGNAMVGGMMVTPALTFGRLLGSSILQWDQERLRATG